ncbi:MAG TPA: hypothetical protein VHX88_05365 [Solirubrobacteraceae bacterium]|jgi:hypothetical protein|nr:hypothetical protein [Solirubrobacteraceae bacterium]
MGDEPTFLVRSYRPVFELERRLYRIDRLRLNPSGVPLRGLFYLLALLALAAVLSGSAVTRWAVTWVPWYVRFVGAPAAGAFLLGLARVDGRPFHLAVRSLLALWCGARHQQGDRRCPAPGARWSPGALVMLPDGSEPRLRRLRYRGPGAVLVATAHRRVEWRHGRLAGALGRPAVSVLERRGRPPARPTVLELAAGARLDVGGRR